MAKQRSEFGSVTKVGSLHEARARWTCRVTGKRVSVKRRFGSHVAAKQALRKVRVLVTEKRTLDEIRQTVFGDAVESGTTFASMVPDYIEYVRTVRKASTAATAANRLKAICRHDWTGKDAAQVTRADLMDWMEARTREPGKKGGTVTPRVVNRELQIVRSLFTWATDKGLCESNPAVGVKRFSESGLDKERFLSVEEIAVLLDACERYEGLRGIVALMLETGMRAGEMLSLEWRDVDVKARRLRVRPENSKSSKGRTVRLTVRAVEAVESMPRGTSKARVVGDSLNYRGLRSRFDKVVLDACIEECTLHTLRHTCASHLAMAGAQPTSIKEILGHSSLTVTERYMHLAPEAGEAAMLAYERHMDAQYRKAV